MEACTGAIGFVVNVGRQCQSSMSTLREPASWLGGIAGIAMYDGLPLRLHSRHAFFLLVLPIT